MDGGEAVDTGCSIQGPWYTLMESDSLSKQMSNWCCGLLLSGQPTDELAADMWAHTWTSLGGHSRGGAEACGRLPGQTSPCHLQWAHSTFPQPLRHSSPRHDRQIHLCRKEELILYIWDSDRLAAPQDCFRTDEIRLKLLWGFTGNWPCQSYTATQCCTASLKINVNPSRICSFTLPYFHNTNVSVSGFWLPSHCKVVASSNAM